MISPEDIVLAKYPNVTVVTFDGKSDYRLLCKAVAAIQAAGLSLDECMQFVQEALRTACDTRQICEAMGASSTRVS
jgi:hypothetical protein